jgi:uncharacterized protein YggU (UPF0235/DUF167 family)
VPFDTGAGDVKVRVRLSPGRARDRVTGVAADENGVAWLTASVTQPPENGRANKALIRLLAKEWRVAKSSIQVTKGRTSRRKALSVAGETGVITDKLAEWLRHRRGDEIT